MIRRSKVSSHVSTSAMVVDNHNGGRNSKRILEFASASRNTIDREDNVINIKERKCRCLYERCKAAFLLCRQATKSISKKSSKKDSTAAIRIRSFLLTSSLSAIFIMLLIQFDAYVREYQGPLDHITTSMTKPYYEITCPSFSYDDNNVKDSSSGGNNENGDNAMSSWDCSDILGTASTADKADDISVNPSFPRIFMIGARDESEDTFQSWQSQLLPSSSSNKKQLHLERMDTLQVSNQFAIAGGALKHHVDNNSSSSSLRRQNKFLCRKIKWEQRLFYVYQRVFSGLLIKYPTDDGFIIVEDDAVLLSPNVFAEEACHAHHQQKFQFYSLYKSPLQQHTRFSFRRNSSSCTYRHGTVAFYIQRHLMEQIVSEHRRSMFCRFPIDMYISKLGPWYATRREVVGHLGRGRIGSS